jgi:hypothetical protein
MHYERNRFRLFVIFVVGLLTVTGCKPKMRRPTSAYLTRATKTQVLSLLRSRANKAPQLKANGKCRLQSYVDGKKQKQNVSVKLWLNPPTEIYLQGDIAFDPQGLVAGTNANEFWLALTPKDISSCWWGQWTDESCIQKILISPKILLETLGIIETVREEDWSLTKKDTFVILAKHNMLGTVIRRVYLSKPDYLVREIHYFDDNGRATIVTELDKYTQISNDFSIPTVIKITKITQADEKDTAVIKLGSIKLIDLTDKQRERLFTRPDPRGFENIYKIINGNIIEQRH